MLSDRQLRRTYWLIDHASPAQMTILADKIKRRQEKQEYFCIESDKDQ